MISDRHASIHDHDPSLLPARIPAAILRMSEATYNIVIPLWTYTLN